MPSEGGGPRGREADTRTSTSLGCRWLCWCRCRAQQPPGQPPSRPPVRWGAGSMCSPKGHGLSPGFTDPLGLGPGTHMPQPTPTVTPRRSPQLLWGPGCIWWRQRGLRGVTRAHLCGPTACPVSGQPSCTDLSQQALPDLAVPQASSWLLCTTSPDSACGAPVGEPERQQGEDLPAEPRRLELLGLRGLHGRREPGHHAGQRPVLSLQLGVHLLQGLDLFELVEVLQGQEARQRQTDRQTDQEMRAGRGHTTRLVWVRMRERRREEQGRRRAEPALPRRQPCARHGPQPPACSQGDTCGWARGLGAVGAVEPQPGTLHGHGQEMGTQRVLVRPRLCCPRLPPGPCSGFSVWVLLHLMTFFSKVKSSLRGIFRVKRLLELEGHVSWTVLTRTWPSASWRSGAPAPSAHAGLTLMSGVHVHEEQPHAPASCCGTPWDT